VLAVPNGVVCLGRAELVTSVWSSAVVVPGVLGQHGSQVSLIEDQHPVGEFGSRGEHESFGEAVRSGPAWRNLDDLDACVSQDAVERCRELAGSIADEKPEFRGPLAEIHQEIAGLLCGSRTVRM
jgi:hypothetical protein